MMYQAICCMSLAAVLALAAGCAGKSPVVWVEGESFTRAPEGLEAAVQDRLPASGGKSTIGSLFAVENAELEYAVTVPQAHEKAKLVFRYSRLHWRKTMKPVDMTCAFTQNGKTEKVTVTFDNTGGWGNRRAGEWGIAEAVLGPVAAGPAVLVLSPVQQKNCDVNLDGFFVAPEDFSVTAEELAACNRILVTSDGYLGLDMTYSAVEQNAFTGMNVIGRGFVPGSEKVSVTLMDKAGKTAVTFRRDTVLKLGNEVSRLPVSAADVKKVADGEYVLRASWDKGAAVLSQPFIAMGNMAVRSEKLSAEIKGYVKEKAGKRIAADLRYAAEYIDNALVLLRSRRHEEQPENAFRAALAYFEKSRQRSAAHFARDLSRIVSQTEETVKRNDAGKDPYAGRGGDLRRAFVSGKTKKLEPYRVFIPSAYEKEKSIPFILLLHGGGGTENSFLDQEDDIVPAVLEKRGYAAAAPRATSWYGDDRTHGNAGAHDMKQLIKLMLKEYPKLDPKRVYCTGVSRGGFGTYNVGVNFPELFRGIACVSGIGGKLLGVHRLKKVPTLVIHGGRDGVIPVSLAREWVDKLEKAGVDHELKVYPKYGHNYHGEEYLVYTLDFFEKRL